jgi:hypothetical protein
MPEEPGGFGIGQTSPFPMETPPGSMSCRVDPEPRCAGTADRDADGRWRSCFMRGARACWRGLSASVYPIARCCQIPPRTGPYDSTDRYRIGPGRPTVVSLPSPRTPIRRRRVIRSVAATLDN